ncbi:MAG: alpha/beta fold hydrolase, partial [Phycisphaerae bacterium]
LLPGIFGDNSVGRTRDIAMALRDSGFHVCAVELRGCGQTEKRFPDHRMTFGTYESGDLLALADWLEQKPHVRRTGLIGFCWGSNVGLVTAWEDGRADDDPGVSDLIQEKLRPRDGKVHFQAGMLLFSSVLPFEDVCDACETTWSVVSNPILDRLQNEIKTRMTRKGYPNPDGSLRRLIEIEAAHATGSMQGVEDGYRFLRLFPYKDLPYHNKLESIRVPTLLVHAANDPLTDAQPLANLIAETENENVAALIIPGGGHVGFGPYAPEYFYSLILRFFDPERGAGGTDLQKSGSTRPAA